MKGLVLKDIYSVRFQIFGAFGIMLFPYIITWLSMFADNYEEVFGGEIAGINLTAVLYALINYLMITVCSSMMLNTISDDAKSGWAKFQRTAPLTVGQIVGAKFAANGVVLGGICVLTIVLNMAGAFVLNIPIETFLTIPIVFAFLQMITLSAATFLGYRFGNLGATIGYIAMIVIVAAGVIAVLFFTLTERISAGALRFTAYLGVPILAAALSAVFFNAAKKAVARDCG